MKRIIRFIIIFWGIIAIFILIYALYPQLKDSLIGIGDGGAYVSTWVDQNANGVREANELPLAHVCVWSGYRPDSQIEDCSFQDYHVTDENGQWGEFLAGSSCDMIYIFAAIPEGYQPTTDLAGKGCSINFGFVEENVKVSHKILSIDEFAQQEIARIRIRNTTGWLFILVVAFVLTRWLEKS